MPNRPKSEEISGNNLRRLFLLRNIELSGICLGLVIAAGIYGIELPLPPLLVILGLVALLNVYTLARLRSGRRVSDHELFVHMMLDVAGLTGIFYYTGGAGNPLIWFYLLPLMIAATINRTMKSFALAIVGAEYILRWLPVGTHQWDKFVTPAELETAIEEAGLLVTTESGVVYNPFGDRWHLSDDTDVNYMMIAEKPA